MELTKKDFEKLVKNLVTKDDLKGLAKETSIDSLRTFLNRHVPTKDDLKEFATKADIKAETNNVLTAIDGLAKQTMKTNEELPAIQNQLTNMKDWILEASKKIGMEYKG